MANVDPPTESQPLSRLPQNWLGLGLGEHPIILGPLTYFCNHWS